MKTNTPSRDMRVLQRELHRIKKELLQTKQTAKSFRTKTFKSNALLVQKLTATENENKIVRKSFTNFALSFNKQRKELSLLKLGIGRIVQNQKRNPYTVRKYRKTTI